MAIHKYWLICTYCYEKYHPLISRNANCYVNVRAHIQTWEWIAVLGDRRHHDLFNSNKQKECCLIQWNIHLFCIFIFMNLSCKRAIVSGTVVLLNTVSVHCIEWQQNINAIRTQGVRQWEDSFSLQGSHIQHNPINNIMLPDECTMFVCMCLCLLSISMHTSKSTQVFPCSVSDFITLYRDMVDGGFPFNVLSIAIWRERPGGHSEMQTSASAWAFIQYKCHVVLQGYRQCHCCPYE